MTYEDVRAGVERLEGSVEHETQAWEDLLLRGKTIGESAQREWQAVREAQAKNLDRWKHLVEKAQGLLDRIANTDGVLSNSEEMMKVWIAGVRGRLDTMRSELDTRTIPELGLDRDSFTEKVEFLSTELREETEQFTTSLTERFLDARDAIVENLSAAVEAVETAFAALIQGLASALDEARSAIDDAWNEAKEANEASREQISEKGEAIADTLTEVLADAVERVTGKLTAVAEDVDRIVATFETTFDTLQRTLDLARTLTEEASVGMGAAARGLDTARNVLSAVA